MNCPDCGAEMYVYRGVLKHTVRDGSHDLPGNFCICQGCRAGFDQDGETEALTRVYAGKANALPAQTEQRICLIER